MRVVLVRHAHADTGSPDNQRPLSARGRDEAAALGAALRSERPVRVITSPLLRARQTAAAIAQETGAQLEIDQRAAPGMSLEDLRELSRTSPEPLVVVGHQPDCSEIALSLTGSDPGFPPAGWAALDIAADAEEPPRFAG